MSFLPLIKMKVSVSFFLHFLFLIQVNPPLFSHMAFTFSQSKFYVRDFKSLDNPSRFKTRALSEMKLCLSILLNLKSA